MLVSLEEGDEPMHAPLSATERSTMAQLGGRNAPIGALRAFDAGDAGPVLGDVAPAQAREFHDVRKDEGL